MSKYQCSICDRNFRQKCHLNDHLNKKNKCKPINDKLHVIATELTIITPIPDAITPNLSNVSIALHQDTSLDKSPLLTSNNIPTCNYCNKTFTRKNVMHKHIKESCKIAKQQNKEKQDIFDKLILEDAKKQEIIDKLKSENELLGKIKQLEDGTKNLENEIKNLKKAMKKTQPITNNTQNNNNINIGNTTNNIIMVSYGHEDLSKITPKMLSTACKKGYNSIIHLVEAVHFNPEFPENHNVYIPSVKDKHAMIFYDDMWNLKNKDDVVNDMYDTNRDYIMENLEGINNLLNDGEKRALNRWLDSEKNKDKSDKDKKAIEITHENLKLLLHNKRHIPVGTRKQKATITM